MTAAPHAPSVFVEVDEAARLAGLSTSAIRRRCATDRLGFQVGGRGPWRIPRDRFVRFMAGEAGPFDRIGGTR